MTPNTMIKTLLLVFISFLKFKPISSCNSTSAPFKITTDTDDFKSLVLKNDFFVDKTLMIEEFMQMLPGCFIPLIIRPRGWGKSTNMDMLKRFYEIEVDNQGQPLPENQTTNDKLFLGGEFQVDLNEPPKKLKPLKISYIPSVLWYMGKMPVILLKLENVTGKNYEEIEQSIKSRVVQAFQSHPYLYNHTLMSPALFGIKNVQKYFNGDFNTTELTRSLFILSGVLFDYFQRRRVVFLIDDYDIPLINAFLEFGHKQKEYDKVVDLLDSMYQLGLKGNIFLHKALVTGILKMSFDTIDHPIARLDNLEICTLFYRRFCQFYGFTRAEMKELLEQLPITIDLNQMISWYGGYGIDEQTYLNGDLVMQAIANNGSLGFYEESGIAGGALIDRIFATDKMQSKYQSLISGEKLIFNHFLHMMRLRWHVLDEFAILLHYGYLNKTNSIVTPYIAIPNKEIQHIFEMKSLQWVANKLGLDTSQFFSFAQFLSNGSIEQFRQTLPKYLSNATQIIQSGEKRSKPIYNGIMIALQTALSSSHQKASVGLTDGFVLVPKLDQSDTAIIFKYKMVKKQEDLDTEAKIGLEEINNFQNSTSLNMYSHMQKINKIAVAFCGINVTVENQTENLSNFNSTDGL